MNVESCKVVNIGVDDAASRVARADALRRRWFPEIGAGGYSRVDGTVEFYGRINALVEPHMHVLDYGAGRGRGLIDDPVPYRRGLRKLQGKCARLVGVDVDEAVTGNAGLDEAHIIRPSEPLPFPDATFDIILSDMVFEHIEDAQRVTRELDRVLRPGGWLCARTPNRWGYIGLGTNFIPNRWHVRLLRRLQPGRKAVDVFPTRYRLNTRGAFRDAFPEERFEHFVYGVTTEPSYVGSSRLLGGVVRLWSHLPESFAAMWMIFLRKRTDRVQD